MAASPGQAPLLSATASLFLNQKYSDVSIQVDGESWPAHKAIICPRSSVFGNAFKGDFEEAKTGVLSLPEDDKIVVMEMLRYLYTADYVDKHPECGRLVFNVKMHTIGDKYDIKDLCELAEEKYDHLATQKWNSSDFADSIVEMYNPPSEPKTELQKTAAKVAVKHAKELLKDDNSDFYKATETIAPFSSRISRELVMSGNLSDREKRYQCPNCHKTLVRETLPKANSERDGWGNVAYCTCTYCGSGYPCSSWKVVEGR